MPAAALVLPELRVLGDAVDDIHPEPVDTAAQPEAQHVVHRSLDLGLVPVEIRLLGQERVQVPLAPTRIPGPCGATAAKLRSPAVGLIAPHVPVAPAGVREPRVPV